MAVEEFDSKHTEFCWILSNILLFFPPIILIVGLCCFFIGPSRVTYISRYNIQAQEWRDVVMNEFSLASFSISSSQGVTPFRNLTRESTNMYPVSDSCDKNGDPSTGCIYVSSVYFDNTVVVFDGEAKYTLLNSDGSTLATIKMSQSSVYYLSPRELGCTYKISECESPCKQENGKWNTTSKLCQITLYLNEVCHRLKFENGLYMIDNTQSHLIPINKAYRAMKSDLSGCQYNNNWNSAVYGRESSNLIHVKLRSNKDAYIAASANTHGCSNVSLNPNDCFGPTRIKERSMAYTVIMCGVAAVILEIVIVITLRYMGKVKHQKAVADALAGQIDNDMYLLNQQMY